MGTFDFQTAFNIILGLFLTLFGWMLNSLWQLIRDLTKADTMLADKVQGIELLVAGQYIKRDEVELKFDAMFKKLDNISEKIDRAHNTGR